MTLTKKKPKPLQSNITCFFQRFSSTTWPIKIFLLFLFLFLSVTNFVSHSELWSITSAKLLGTFEPEALVVYLRPLFYLFLKIPYFFDLNNTQHIQLARAEFGVIAFLNFILCYKIAKILSSNKSSAILYSVFLLSFHVYFYNSYRVRSDVLSELFALLCLLRLLTPRKRFFLFHGFDFSLPILSFLLSLTTPKSIYFFALLCVVYVIENRHIKSKFIIIKDLLFYFLAPAYILILISLLTSLIVPNIDSLFAVALNYYLNSFYNSWSLAGFTPLLRSLQINFVHYAIIFFGFILWIRNRQGSRRKNTLAVVFIFGLITLLIHPERWDYFIASIIPFIAMPSLIVFNKITRVSTKVALAFIFICMPLYMTHYKSWWKSNEEELNNIRILASVIAPFPEWKYFDATGALPRANAAMWFLGPNDKPGNLYTIEHIKTRLPEVIFRTPKLEHGGGELIILLFKHYTEVQPGLWIKKNKVDEFTKNFTLTWNYPPMSIFVYDYPPQIRSFKLF